MPFLPTDVANLWGWYKADAGVTQVSNDVSAWADQSGNGHNLSLANPSYPVSYVAGAINSLPAIRSKQTSSNYGTLFSGSNIPAMTKGTVFLVVKRHSGNNIIDSVTNIISSGDNFFVGVIVVNDPSSIYAQATSSSNGVYLPNSQETWYTIRVRFTDVNNGASIAGSVNNATELTDTTAAVGADWPLGLFDAGDVSIAEVLIYTDSITNDNADLIEYYLQQKYNHYSWTGSIPTNNSTMADVDNIIQGTDIELWLRESGTSAAYQKLICFLSLPFALTSEVTKKKSSCGTHVATQDADAEVSGSAICNIDPGATEVSYDQMVSWQIAKTALDFKYVNKATTINGQSYAEGDIINFTGSCKVTSTTFKADATTDESIEFDFNLSMGTPTKA